jgi:hypothetical protein
MLCILDMLDMLVIPPDIDEDIEDIDDIEEDMEGIPDIPDIPPPAITGNGVGDVASPVSPYPRAAAAAAGGSCGMGVAGYPKLMPMSMLLLLLGMFRPMSRFGFIFMLPSMLPSMLPLMPIPMPMSRFAPNISCPTPTPTGEGELKSMFEPGSTIVSPSTVGENGWYAEPPLV